MAGADKIPNIPPNRNPFPGSLTPGWNDPPTLASTPAKTVVRPRLNLKQRVAFPLNNSNTTTTLPNTPAIVNHVVNKPIAMVPPQCAAAPVPATTNTSSLPPLPPLPPKVDASSWPVATVHPRQK